MIQPTHVEHPVDRGAQLGRTSENCLASLGELVRVRVRTDRSTASRAVAADHDRAREHPSPGACRPGRTRLSASTRRAAGARRRDAGIGRDLVTGAQDEDVVQHHLGGAISVPRRSRRTRACGACSSASSSSARFARNSCTEPMIVFAIARDAEQGILPAPEQQQDEEARGDDPVEEREHVRADDAPRRCGSSGGEGVRSPAAMRSATWVCVSPTAGSTCAGSASTSLTASMDHTL